MSANESKRPVLVICPMECEYTTLKSALAGSTTDRFNVYEYTKGFVDGYPVIAVKTLVGGVNSAVATAHFIEKYDPLCVIVQGTAGAHDENLRVNDIIIAENILDCGIYFAPHRDEGCGSCPGEWERPGTETLNENGESERRRVYHSSERLMKIAEATPYAHGRKRRGTLYSADAWNRELDLIVHFNKTAHTDCEEMENFAVAHICEMFGVEHLGIRIISNSERLADQRAFSPEAGKLCQLFCLDIIARIIAAQK